jgi:hypothetical protein
MIRVHEQTDLLQPKSTANHDPSFSVASMTMRTVCLTIVAFIYTSTACAQSDRSFEQDPFDDLVVPEVEDQDRVALAQALTAEGLSSYENGDHETAARQLEVSYRIRPDAENLDILGLALLALGHHSAAVERLTRYLDEAASIDSERRERAETALAQTRQRFARLSVSTAPLGARLSVDGESVGVSPLDTPLSVSGGAHSIRAELAGYHDATEEIVVDGGADMELLLNLEPIDGAGRQGLNVGFWSTIGITIAFAVALVPAIAFAVIRTNELNEVMFPTSSMRRSAVAWRASSLVLGGLTGASTLGAVVVGLLRVRNERSR